MADWEVNFQIPCITLTNPALIWPTTGSTEIIEVNGFLHALSVGTLTVEFRDQDETSLATLTFTPSSKRDKVEFASPFPQIPDGGEVRVYTTLALVVGGDTCYLNMKVRT